MSNFELMRITATTLHGLEDVLVQEIEQIGGENIEKSKRAVLFDGDKELLYRANLQLRTAIRVLVPIQTFRARSEDDLYNRVKRINWAKYMSNRNTLAIDASASSNIFRHSKYVALKTKDAIVDQFRDRTGKRPNVNIYNPTLRINVHINQTEVTISLDSSGDSLHKRGYKVDSLEAPISEVLAAGMLLLSGWDARLPLIDPMCGSGTIPIEAALIATKTPPGIFREQFGFETWRDFDSDLWEKVKKAALEKVIPCSVQLLGTDESFKAIRIAQRNVEAARMEKYIELKRSKFEKLQLSFDEGILVFNPPYDERLENENINDFYQLIGDQLKNNWQGYTAWMISSNFQALKHVGLRPSKKIILFNGPLECKFQKFEMYAGSKKKKKQA